MGGTYKENGENEGSIFFFFLKPSSLKHTNLRSSAAYLNSVSVVSKGTRDNLKCGPQDLPGRDGMGTD